MALLDVVRRLRMQKRRARSLQRSCKSNKRTSSGLRLRWRKDGMIWIRNMSRRKRKHRATMRSLQHLWNKRFRRCSALPESMVCQWRKYYQRKQREKRLSAWEQKNLLIMSGAICGRERDCSMTGLWLHGFLIVCTRNSLRSFGENQAPERRLFRRQLRRRLAQNAGRLQCSLAGRITMIC